MKKFVLLTTLLLTTYLWQLSAIAKSGIYLNVLSGWANASGYPSQSSLSATSLNKDSAPIVRIGIGYLHDFNFNPHYGFGFEVGSGWYGRSTYSFADNTQDTVQNTTTEFLAVLMRHFKKIDLFTKVGGIRNTSQLDSATSGDVLETDIQLQAGGGINYSIAKHVALSAAYYHTFSDNVLITTSTQGPNWTSPSLDELLIGLRFNFG